MSETQRTREASTRRSPGARESPYPRENYFASVDDEYDPEREPLDDTRNDHHLRTLDRGTSKDEWIVATLQKGQATMLCPYALNESPDAEWALHDENGEVVLSDPSEYPPPASGFVTPETDTAARKPSTSQWRFNPDHGYLVFGGIPAISVVRSFSRSSRNCWTRSRPSRSKVSATPHSNWPPTSSRVATVRIPISAS